MRREEGGLNVVTFVSPIMSFGTSSIWLTFQRPGGKGKETKKWGVSWKSFRIPADWPGSRDWGTRKRHYGGPTRPPWANLPYNKKKRKPYLDM